MNRPRYRAAYSAGLGFDAGFSFAEGESAFAAGERQERERAEREAQERQRRERQERYHAYFRNGYRPESPFEVLGVRPGASHAEIRSAWIRLVKQYHPDHGGDAALFRKVQNAYETLRPKAAGTAA